jgi:hypothetical protein
MFKIPLCLEVVASDDHSTMLEDMGIEPNDDLYEAETFVVCFYKIDAIMHDLRSTKKKPISCVVCGELMYLVKIDMATLVERISAIS